MVVVDLGEFSSDSFDAKQWINSALETRHPQDPLDRFLSDLEETLRSSSDKIASSLDRESADALRRVPLAVRDVLRLRDDAVSLRSVVSSILLKIKKAEATSAESIAALSTIDTVKQRMEAAYETLQDAAGLTQLSASVEDVFASGDLPRAAETLANMRHCLSAVGEVAEFANVRKQPRRSQLLLSQRGATMGERRTLMLVNLAGIMERADEALLPAVYKEVGAALHASPTGLGSLTLFRSIVQSLCYPLAAYAAIRYNRAHVIAVGAFLWAAATFLVALSSTYLQVAISRALNGIGLALVTPAIQSLVADSTDDNNRGVAFGWLQLTGSIGSILGGFFSLSLASSTFYGIEGWRFAFHLVAIISVIVGVLVRLFAVDPNYVDNATRINAPGSTKSVWTEVEDLVKEAKAVMKIQSFQIIVAQGITGSFPWSALSFAPMWLELIGFSHNMTGFLMIMFVIANALGGLFGGKMGDYLSTRFPNSGRIILSQISSASAIPLAAVLMLVLPDDPSTVFSHVLVLFIMGLSMSWNSAATNNPIFAEIVPEKSRTSIYALDRSFESVLSSFAPPFVGILAQNVYGYKPIPYGSSEHTTIETDRKNAAPLAKALYTAIAIPMTLCCLIYSFLYCTYPRDRERAHMVSLVESEMQQIESENSPDVEDYSQSSQTGWEPFQKERRANDTFYVEDLEIGDTDEKMLLSGKLSSSR